MKHLKDRPMRVVVRIDGGTPMRRRARSVLIGTVGRLQGGVRLLSEAQPDDGVLDIAILTPSTLRTWAAMGWGLMRRSKRVPAMEVFRGARVEVISNRPHPRQLDGDLVETSDRLIVELTPQALRLCVPQPVDNPDLAVDANAATAREAGLLDAAR